MAEMDYRVRQEITREREAAFQKRKQSLTGEDRGLAEAIHTNCYEKELVSKVRDKFYTCPELTPSQWIRDHKGLLRAFVPKAYDKSYLYIIDKLHQFPFTRGWARRSVRTKSYWPQIQQMFQILTAYEKLFYCEERLEDVMLGRLSAEKLEYIRREWNFTDGFHYLYAAEIDRGNQVVIEGLKSLILSENNTAYLDREMILGIIQSDHQELQELLCKLLLAARLQEGLRQAICESMDEGTPEAFLKLLQVIEDHDLIRYSSVLRSISTWIGIFSESSADRINKKLLQQMGECLRDPQLCQSLLKTNDSISISVALWALGFREAQDAVDAMKWLIDYGTKNQKLTASYYNRSLYDEKLRVQVAKKVILEKGEDLELAAAFLPAYTEPLNNYVRELIFEKKSGYYTFELVPPRAPNLKKYFENKKEAEQLYECFLKIYHCLPKKALVFDPCIFPWYRVELSVSSVVAQLAFTAYVLQDEEKITFAAGLLDEADGDDRKFLIHLLLYSPKNQMQRNLVISYMGSSKTQASHAAIKIVKGMQLSGKEYEICEDMLRFKRNELRAVLIELLMKQKEEHLKDSLTRLLKDKREEKRSGGLDILMRLSKDKKQEKVYEKVRPLIALVASPTDKEKILIEELKGENTEEQEGYYKIYNPEASEELLSPVQIEEASPEIMASKCLPFTEKEIIEKLVKLDRIFQENRNYEYVNWMGEKEILGNKYTCLKESGYPQDLFQRFQLKNFPLEAVFRQFYEEELGSYASLVELEAVLSKKEKSVYSNGEKFYKKVFGKLPFQGIPFTLEYEKQILDLKLVYRYEYLEKKELLDRGIQMVSALLPLTDGKNKMIPYMYKAWNGRESQMNISLSQMPLFIRYFEGLQYWETDEEFIRAFSVALQFEIKIRENRKYNTFARPTNYYGGNSYSYPNMGFTPICPYWFFKAYHLGIITKDLVYRAILEYFHCQNCLQVLSRVVKGECVRPMSRGALNYFFGSLHTNEIYEIGESYFGEDTWIGKLIREFYEGIVPVIVDMELRRGEAETEVTWMVQGIDYIRGMDVLIRILMALGKDTLSRDSYYFWYYGGRSQSKKEVLSRLLKVCYPAVGETGKDLTEALKKTKIKETRLVEVAMYAPQWIDIIQEHLDWKGLKSGCYYFMAHMNERFDDQKQAMIAKYTPLSPEELQNGAFDVDWFEEAYEQLGEKNFGLLYQAAKYISDGQKHSRARKYADAATGKVTLEDLKREISAKRNKDLLMSYSLVPFQKDREKDMLDRYQFIQQFLKESRQFGAQRRASEGKAAEIALVNLSVRAGYGDVTRLTLNMETRLVEAFESLMCWNQVEDIEVCLHVGEDGKSEILCRKNEKPLKSIPSRLGKNPYVLQLKEAHKKLKDQYSRTKKMMEEAMESGTSFRAMELRGLLENPVVRAILEPLVFMHKDSLGFLSPGGKVSEKQDSRWIGGSTDLYLKSWEGEEILLKPEEELRIAHALDLYQAKQWAEYQKYLFAHAIRQPFKQVFRELYVKLPEELGLKASRMFAGNQIQPQKTVGCLRNRRWVADYEEGLQKIYYKENIVARIYAMADWFSPSDVEAPTLEWVEFSDRKTFQALTIAQVPDLIYSEVMRDVDLAVSVAHAGGVDPETSHSTIEMRRAIVELNLPLFGLKNVTLTDSHAMIQGVRAVYNVHLGSGVVHQEGGAMLHILPVHSQKRGRLFLPFVDEDPKTAEIMSKIVLLAEDKKIKDPSILSQIL
ncbi:MAG: DUF4132 domain-containing protein [Lachnospiraceae bacterium]|nr:DUF4132 domain-containing protein [Lachnospiraceae bacterium]